MQLYALFIGEKPLEIGALQPGQCLGGEATKFGYAGIKRWEDREGLLVGFEQKALGRTSHKGLFAEAGAKTETEAVARKLFQLADTAPKAVPNPRPTGAHFASYGKHLVHGPHAVEHQGLAHLFAQKYLTPKGGLLHGIFGPLQAVESGFAHGDDIGMAEGLFQSRPSRLVRLVGLPGMNAHGIERLPIGDILRTKRERLR